MTFLVVVVKGDDWAWQVVLVYAETALEPRGANAAEDSAQDCVHGDFASANGEDCAVRTWSATCAANVWISVIETASAKASVIFAPMESWTFELQEIWIASGTVTWTRPDTIVYNQCGAIYWDPSLPLPAASYPNCLVTLGELSSLHCLFLYDVQLDLQGL